MRHDFKAGDRAIVLPVRLNEHYYAPFSIVTVQTPSYIWNGNTKGIDKERGVEIEQDLTPDQLQPFPIQHDDPNWELEKE